ncbi:hypothetical protein FB45DRAFT_927851 [Roridomyces roridus]|uniref:Uncharacterized protein n=1 Tax=Roridomyces roridus TaxID=1738132 RepID=A0AAD7BJ08_9AGAR|nr:hypothetical protein FB45DRAFT_927851 [Roridomyces roridus]
MPPAFDLATEVVRDDVSNPYPPTFLSFGSLVLHAPPIFTIVFQSIRARFLTIANGPSHSYPLEPGAASGPYCTFSFFFLSLSSIEDSSFRGGAFAYYLLYGLHNHITLAHLHILRSKGRLETVAPGGGSAHGGAIQLLPVLPCLSGTSLTMSSSLLSVTWPFSCFRLHSFATDNVLEPFTLFAPGAALPLLCRLVKGIVSG